MERINMKFGDALEWSKQGFKIARKGWNAKNLWIAYQSGRVIDIDEFWNPHTKDFAKQNGGKAEVLPYMIMKTADDKILMGWLASQTDMLSDDWEVITKN